MIARQRADLLLVARGLFDSRAKAQAAIAAGHVTANGAPVRKPSDTIAVDAEIAAEPAFPWVSRGGVKLAHALDRLGFDVAGHVCLDVGASTGGFTEVLAERGARLVYAVDGGRGQLHPRLRGRPDIVSIEETDIRALDAARLTHVPAKWTPVRRQEHAPIDERPDVVTIDVSFISLRHVLPAALALAAPRMRLVALVKPQFEIADRRALKKGIVRDPALHASVVADLAAVVVSLGCEVDATFPSPIDGGDGNREFFIGAHRG